MNKNEKLRKGDIILHGGKYYLLIDWCPPCNKLWLQGIGGTKTTTYKDAKLVKIKP